MYVSKYAWLHLSEVESGRIGEGSRVDSSGSRTEMAPRHLKFLGLPSSLPARGAKRRGEVRCVKQDSSTSHILASTSTLKSVRTRSFHKKVCPALNVEKGR